VLLTSLAAEGILEAAVVLVLYEAGMGCAFLVSENSCRVTVD